MSPDPVGRRADERGERQVWVSVRSRAAALGISAQQIEQALAASFGSQQISTIYTASNQYQVIVELEDRYQRDAAALGRLYIRSASGTLTPERSRLDASCTRRSISRSVSR